MQRIRAQAREQQQIIKIKINIMQMPRDELHFFIAYYSHACAHRTVTHAARNHADEQTR